MCTLKHVIYVHVKILDLWTRVTDNYFCLKRMILQCMSCQHFLKSQITSMSDGLTRVTLQNQKVFNEQCDPALLARRFSKQLELWVVSGRSTCYASICPSDTHAHKSLYLDTNTDTLLLPSSYCPFLSAVLKSTAAADGSWFPVHLLTLLLCSRLPSRHICLH